MPILLKSAPILGQRSPVGISTLIDSMRSGRAIDPLKLADGLDQLQSGIQAIMKALREGVTPSGDSIQVTDGGGALGLTITNNSITITSGGNTITITPTYVDVKTEYRVAGVKVLGVAPTGWSAPTATLSRTGLTNASTAAQVLQTVAALQTDLLAQGIIKP